MPDTLQDLLLEFQTLQVRELQTSYCCGTSDTEMVKSPTPLSEALYGDYVNADDVRELVERLETFVTAQGQA